jgi:hypothetical protein
VHQEASASLVSSIDGKSSIDMGLQGRSPAETRTFEGRRLGRPRSDCPHPLGHQSEGASASRVQGHHIGAGSHEQGLDQGKP